MRFFTLYLLVYVCANAHARASVSVTHTGHTTLSVWHLCFILKGATCREMGLPGVPSGYVHESLFVRVHLFVHVCVHVCVCVCVCVCTRSCVCTWFKCVDKESPCKYETLILFFLSTFQWHVLETTARPDLTLCEHWSPSHFISLFIFPSYHIRTHTHTCDRHTHPHSWSAQIHPTRIRAGV